ncbi:DMT family transporter [Tuwongella immobilis]|uniref:EamA domain-containing protein n=1 Tax=Tuwongella immobilis TaxID=692036 RepID=A0A6C2YJJ6_9BACT|nr:DMT family transporter [Tuwongella immobilis]VIP01547.1 Uncharacterized protein OS=Acetohalobium arabaticum (strain ATCC 49924 / DSM 5501 / Z-7288) GN=Acear_1207 PE=4 SV=1: DUF606 [Tuwongella immobilis]VTR98733.1 Uncharacterized protein OS=Acetohalobium arabaticum (strain ATCC 49924 / DSM 5501 / Z-7288) GN=Acear_1207 PE=4 SV=1: DUF606 [Tuwongella immobilis]
MNWVYLLVALVGGIAIAIQVAVNSQLKLFVGSPMQATLISFTIGLTACIGFCVIAQYRWPAWSELAKAPWWAWGGGLLGVFYLGTSIVAARQLGVAATVGTVIAGQVITSLVIDHYGLLGIPVRPASIMRGIGVTLILVGVWIVSRSQ